MKSILWVIRFVIVAAFFAVSSQAQAMEGYIVCGVCKYFEPSSRSCQQAPSCSGMEGFGYDCGHCATWYADSERGHCETIVGCGGATSLSWPQVLCGESQSAVADAHEVIYNANGPGGRR